jgi:hypothetical protein
MRAASFKSLYQKRPSKTMHLRAVAGPGAPDTALRLKRTNLNRLLKASSFSPISVKGAVIGDHWGVGKGNQ